VKKEISGVLVVAGGLLAVVVVIAFLSQVPEGSTLVKVDDWQYSPGGGLEEAGGLIMNAVQSIGSGGIYESRGAAPGAMYESAADSIGFSVGGAKDINNFRDNVENDYLPIVTDMTYEGLFYDYYFDTGELGECDKKLFCPAYSYAVSRDPFSEETGYYMTVGLNSGMKEEDFERKKLNLVVVLDISGSMSSPFNRYYYDGFGNPVEIEDYEEEDTSKSKMEIANEAVVMLLDRLEGEDRFGMVLFESNSHIAKRLRPVGETDMERVKEHILEVTPRGSTYMEAGMRDGTGLFGEYLDVGPAEYENRIIFLTDAMPNIGDISEEDLLGMMQRNAENGIYMTFIGIGVDFNTEIIEAITKVRGANYYSVHSSKQFKERMDEGFDYMVTPLVFDLELRLESEGWEIEKVYGSPEADEATGEIMKVNTLFPSKRVEGETKGGIVLLKLKEKNPDGGSIKLKVSYEDREGNKDSNEKTVEFESKEPAEYFENTGIRKGILLSSYANLVKNWIVDERESIECGKPIIYPRVTRGEGIILPPPEPVVGPYQLGRWERQSAPLRVSEHYQGLFEEFAEYFEEEMDAIGDETLERELDILEKLSTYSGG
jgi:Ca-activated chloride channel family protein